MRTVFWLVFVVALLASSPGCDSSESVPEVDADAEVNGRRDAERGRAGARAEPRDRDSSVRPDVDPDAQVQPQDAGADARAAADRDSEADVDGSGADSDGGVDTGGSGIRYAGGDGSACEHAVVILGARSSFEGIRAEYDWLNKHYPGAEVLGQALARCGEHWADILSIRTAQGETREVYFDIDDFFGK